MATETVNEQTEREYVRSPIDSLTAKTAHLCALLAMLDYANDGDDSFSDLADELRYDYMAHCAELARECRELAKTVAQMAMQKQHGGAPCN